MPSFFGDDEFSFLDTYRERRVNDEDESDNERSQTSPSSSSVSEGNDEQEFVYTSTASFDLPQSPPHLLQWRARKIVVTMTRMMSRLLGEGRRQKGK